MPIIFLWIIKKDKRKHLLSVNYLRSFDHWIITNGSDSNYKRGRAFVLWISMPRSKWWTSIGVYQQWDRHGRTNSNFNWDRQRYTNPIKEKNLPRQILFFYCLILKNRKLNMYKNNECKWFKREIHDFVFLYLCSNTKMLLPFSISINYQKIVL